MDTALHIATREPTWAASVWCLDAAWRDYVADFGTDT